VAEQLLGGMMGKKQISWAWLAAGALFAVAGCDDSITPPPDAVAQGTDALVLADVDAHVEPEVFDQDGALGFNKAPPLPLMAAGVQSRFQIPSTFTVGQFQPGVWVLPNGRLLTPAGDQVELKSYAMGVTVHPNGKFAYISNDREDGPSLQVVDIAQKKLIQAVKRNDLYRFLVVSPDGQYLYASGGPQVPAWRMKIAADGTLTEDRSYAPNEGFMAIALSPDAKTLYGVTSFAQLGQAGTQLFSAYDADTGAKIFSLTTATTPYDMVVTQDGNFAYLVTWRDGNVQRVDLANPATPTAADTLPLGFNAQGIVVSGDGKTLWASIVEADEIAQIDAVTLQVVKRIPVGMAPLDQPLMAPRGRDPGLMALSPDGRRLYVVCAMSNEVSVVDTAAGKVIGAIPVGWYPSGIAVTPDGKTIVVANAKGTGLPPWDGTTSVEKSYIGTLSLIATPDDAALKQGQKDVLDNMIGVTGQGRLPQTEASKVVMPLTGASPQIKHVVYLMRENKTFDVELGDVGTTIKDVKADPKYALFGEEFTPNLHKLAKEYCLLDNFYTDGDYSATGHGYATAGKPSDYIEKFYGLPSADPTWNVGKASAPGQGFFFSQMLAWGYSAADFGEIVGMNQEYIFDNVLQGSYPGVVFNLGVKDEEKANYIAEWLKTNDLPTFTFISMPNNHTCCGGTPDKPSPRSMVADNDLGTGIVIDALSKNPAWHETVVFIFEDDPQDGGDSVAYHRSPLIVVSPWVKRGTVVHDHHATGSIHATMERLLDMTPLTELDALASPIYGCFADHADDGLYAKLDRLYPETLNKDEKGKTWNKGMQKAWDAMQFDAPDQNRGLGRLLWQMYKGTPAPWPNWLVGRGGDVDADD
jgi:YVTN family beta-propeller protein